MVGLEDHLVGLNSDGERRGLESGSHLSWVGWSDVNEARNLNGGLGLGVIRAVVVVGNTVSRGVWVDGLELSVVSLVVLVSVGLETTVATVVSEEAVRARNELLLREGKELSSGNEMGTFDGTSGGERPA